MRIVAEAKVYWRSTSISDELRLAVKFNVPGKFFKVRRKRILCDSWWYRYDATENFLRDCLRCLSADYLRKEAEDMVRDYVNREAKNLVLDDLEAAVNSELKKLKGKFEVVVDVNNGKE